MSLGTEVDLCLRNIVFDMDPTTPRKKAQPPPPNFRPMSIVVTVARLSYCRALVAQLTAECLYTLQWASAPPLKIARSRKGIWTPV